MTLLFIKRSAVITIFFTIAITPTDVSSFTVSPSMGMIWPESSSPGMHKRTVPSKTDGVEIELPNFDELFHRIKLVSPLARLVLEGGTGGFANADYGSTYKQFYD